MAESLTPRDEALRRQMAQFLDVTTDAVFLLDRGVPLYFSESSGA